jgi:arylsulfatase A-like enzyme
VLAVSFSATDVVGHQFGPRSHEVQDVLARLDVVLGGLLDALDQKVGPDKYLLVLTADHGVAPIPEQTTDGGRLQPADVKDRANQALATVLGGTSTWRPGSTTSSQPNPAPSIACWSPCAPSPAWPTPSTAPG